MAPSPSWEHPIITRFHRPTTGSDTGSIKQLLPTTDSRRVFCALLPAQLRLGRDFNLEHSPPCCYRQVFILGCATCGHPVVGGKKAHDKLKYIVFRGNLRGSRAGVLQLEES